MCAKDYENKEKTYLCAYGSDDNETFVMIWSFNMLTKIKIEEITN